MKKIICIILITVTSILSGCNSTSDEEIYHHRISKRIMRFRPMELRKKLILYQMLSLHQVKKSILT